MGKSSSKPNFKLDWANSTVGRNMNVALNRIKPAAEMFMRTKAIQIQADMQKNRPWTDRTGMAKLTLNTYIVKPNPNLIRLVMAHGMSYGKWLEIAHGRKYNILLRTLNKEGPELQENLWQFMDMVFANLSKAGKK